MQCRTHVRSVQSTPKDRAMRKGRRLHNYVLTVKTRTEMCTETPEVMQEFSKSVEHAVS